ncbi:MULTISPECIES: FAD-dependent oxidoreductase [Salinibaculum]|uniref:FAD-dependent oxidoreductase n=1 Tax=Salinibaculum TaxID=2732368 RepID=UPI0030CD7395
MTADGDAERDVVVVGSGVGGMACAVTAAVEGNCSVTVLEKAPVLGGSSGLSGAQLWVPANHLMQARGIDDSVEQAVAYLGDLAGSFYENPGAARWFAEHASEAITYFDDVADLDVQIIEGIPDYHTDAAGAKAGGRYLEPEPLDSAAVPDWADLPDSPHLPGGVTTTEILAWGGALTPGSWDWDTIQQRRADGVVTMGTALIGYFLRAADAHDVDVRTDAGVTGLLTEGDAVVGVEVDGDDGPERVLAREGVLLNTGAYDWNEAMVENFEGTPADDVVSAAMPTATGDGLRMAALEGAKLGVYPPVGGAKGFFIEVPDREFLGAPLYRYCYNVGLPHALAIDSDGERFCDESFYPKQAGEFYDPTGEYESFPHYMVFDETYRQTYGLGNYRPGTDYPESFLAGSADSLAGLADQLDVPTGALESTVDRFNEHAREGTDPDFGRGENEWAHVWCGDPDHEPNPNLGPLDDPPYYAVRLYVGLSSMSNTGLVTDRAGAVLDWNDEPIDGLYATGSVTAPVEWGVGYQSGLQNARSLTYGYLAGLDMAEK